MTALGGERWARPQTILVATDLNDLERLMPFALQMAGEINARLLLLHVLSFAAEYSVDAAGMPYYDPDSAFLCADNVLESWCRRAAKQGIDCEAIVRGGHSPAREILAALRQFEADRIVLGTRSRSKLGKLILGSVAEQVLRSANLPVFTVGPEAHLPAPGSGREPTVLLATALGEGYQAGAALACHIASARRARLLFLHVLPPLSETASPRRLNCLDLATLHELTSLAHEAGSDCVSDVELKVAHGDPAGQILAEAEARNVDLVILGAAQHRAIDGIFRDHTVNQVIAHSHCPVLTLRRSTAAPAPRVPAEWPSGSGLHSKSDQEMKMSI